MVRSSKSNSNSTANLGFEAKLWPAADSRGKAKTVEVNKQQTRILAAVLDTLLPRLLSGEMRTPNVRNN